MARYTRVASTWFCELNVPALCVAAALGATMASSSQAAPSVPTSNCATLEDHGGGVFHLHIDPAHQFCIAEYVSFDVGTGETLTFLDLGTNPMPADQFVLNRVTDPGASMILGMLFSAQGTVYLTNTDGITFGADSVVNMGTAGLVPFSLMAQES